MMDKMRTGRIGIFEYGWSMYSFIRDFVIDLAEAGYAVDVFQKDPSSTHNFANLEQLNNAKNVRLFKFSSSGALAERALRKCNGLLRRLSWKYRQDPRSYMDGELLLKSRKIVSESKYECFIGVEKMGLIWAGMLAQVSRCPVIYYSLELYIEDHPGIEAYSHLRKAEKEYHQLSAATIIQDKPRAMALLEYNEVRRTDLIYFPISVRGPIVEGKSCIFHQRHNIQREKKLLLYFGMIQQERFSTDLLGIAGRLQDDVMLVLHGYGDPAYLAYLRSLANTDRVILSFDFVAEEEILDVISSATIGLALYDGSNLNDRLAAFSSVKVAYYLQCGVPIIAFDSESFRELMGVHKCGELISSIDEIPARVQAILGDYDSYRQQAFLAFRQFYDFDRNFEKFLLSLDDFVKTKCGPREGA